MNTTHVPMLSSYVLQVLQNGGHIVHEVVSEQVVMRLVENSGQTVMNRVFAEAGYLLSSGLARVQSEVMSSRNVTYHRVIVSN